MPNPKAKLRRNPASVRVFNSAVCKNELNRSITENLTFFGKIEGYYSRDTGDFTLKNSFLKE